MGRRRTSCPAQGVPRDEALRADYRKLIAIRTRPPGALARDAPGARHDGRLLRLPPARRGVGDAVVVAVNRGAEPVTVTLRRPRGVGRRGCPRTCSAAVAAAVSEGAVALDPSAPERRASWRPATLSRGGTAMAEVVFKDVAKRYGDVSVIEGLNLEIQDHEFMVLVGPVGLRQVDGPADDRRPRGDLRRHDRDRRPGGERRCPRRTATSPWSSRATRSTRT